MQIGSALEKGENQTPPPPPLWEGLQTQPGAGPCWNQPKPGLAVQPSVRSDLGQHAQNHFSLVPTLVVWSRGTHRFAKRVLVCVLRSTSAKSII